MRIAISNLYAEYGRYIDVQRALPSINDCLKPVERRILVALQSVARNKLVKSARVIGEVIGKYHPHGDQSAYETLIKLVTRGLVIGQGNWGAESLNKDIVAAKFRYTECKINPDIDKLAFEFVKFVPWNDPEGIQYEQPDFLPCPIPIGLIGQGLIEGIGFHTVKMPRFHIQDLVKRLINIYQRQTDPNIPIHTIIPQFTNCDVFEDVPGEFERILTTGQGVIKVIPQMFISHKEIIIKAKPVGGFGQLLTNTDNPKKPDQPKYKVKDLTSNGELEIGIIPKSKTVDQDFVDFIYNLISSNVYIKCTVVIADYPEIKSIDELLINSFNVWTKAFTDKLNSEKVTLEEKIFDIKIIELVRNILQAHPQVKLVQDILNVYNSNPQGQIQGVGDSDILRIVKRYSIHRLIEFKTDITKYQSALNNVNSQLQNMTQTAYSKMIDLIPI